MASQNNTTVDIDVNGDGDLTDAVDINDLVLQEGGSLPGHGYRSGGAGGGRQAGPGPADDGRR